MRPTVKTPLAQASGKRKLLIAIPGCALATVLLFLNVAPGITRFFAVVMGAYALVGLVEVLMGESLLSAGKRWDQLAGWKKFAISLVVIIAAIVIFIGVMPLVAKVIYGI
jgi:hypothetical protein